MINVSGTGTSVTLLALQSFPMGFTLSNFADDIDPMTSEEVEPTGFEMLYDGEEVNMMVLTMPLSVFDKKSAGYPIGGSLEFAKKIEETYG